MLSARNINLLLISLVTVVYCILLAFSWDFCYFWDTIQQISKEAFWFYKTDFSSLLIHSTPELDISPTGYHPPLISLITAFLWKIFGYKLWVSHAFTFLWAILLIYNTWKILFHFFLEKWHGLILLILLFEPTVLTQFVIASPDFILLTAFVISLRAILENKRYILAIALIFLCGISMRGVFVGFMLFLSNLYFDYLQQEKYSAKNFGKVLLPYLPTVLLLLSYFTYYLVKAGWFFSNSNYTQHYIMPENLLMAIKHLAELVFRFIENGRIFICCLTLYFIFYFKKNKKNIIFTSEQKMLIAFFTLTSALWFLFVFTTQMPFAGRYFMPQYFVLSILVLQLSVKFFSVKKLKLIFVFLLIFIFTGHCWIYPEKIAKTWENTLLHTPYYNLRKKCFDYIDKHNFDYNCISSAFPIGSNRGYVELKNEGKIIGGSLDRKYFIYSNICNLEDEKIDELKNAQHWMPLKTFKQWPVFITIYQNLEPHTIEK